VKLRCKIYPKYLDLILNGKKKHEYREVEGIEFNDGKRKVLVEIASIHEVHEDYAKPIRKKYPDVPWQNKPMIEIELGKVILSGGQLK